ncbi:alpha/beta fold hydrolase [Bacillus sp. 3255]|uniref:alpha/beta fold hydrolase n=1 Tax=Bacillus sp. 3255 TaxID=2817904 RepID=UPI0028678090|nr:alpha/beta fold hydrolase [Bacillus sp. 3255]MDR6878593.1 pimeloyl-ACP methyl ester carboxylesterase [Bacillus sp. 3255]
MAFAHVNGVSLYYELIPSTSCSEETIVLLHGNGFDSSRWGRLVDGLKEDYRLLLVDLRGCGQSEPTLDEVSWGLFVDDVYVLTRQLQIDSFHLLGHSFGGSLAVAFAIRYPNLVQCLILISMNMLFPEKDGSVAIDSYLNLIDSHGLPYTLEKFLVPALTVAPFEHEEAQRLYHMYLGVSIANYTKLFKLQVLSRQLSELHVIQNPTLLLAGEFDTVYPSSFQNMTAERIPGATFYIVPHAANAVFIDQPGVTVQWIKGFIRRKMEGAPVVRTAKDLAIAGSLQQMRNSFIQTFFADERQDDPVLKVELMYGFRVFVNGRELLDGWNKRYATNIMAYLVMHPSSIKEELCDAVFPNVPLPAAMKNLKVYINYLKKLLMQDGVSLLKSDHKRLYFQCKVECDLVDFLEDLQTVRLMEDRDEKKYELSLRLIRSMRQKQIMSGLYDQWFIDMKANAEFRLGMLMAWMSEREGQRGDTRKAEELRKLANYYLSSDE